MPISIDGTNGLTFADGTTQTTEGLTGYRNRIVNGDMRIAQRGTSFTNASSGQYCCDKFRYRGNNAANLKLSRETDAPTSTGIIYSQRVTVNTPQATISAGEHASICTSVEGWNIQDLFNTPFTLSFWVRSSKLGKHCVGFRNGNQTRSYITEYTINSVNTWEKKVITLTSGLPTNSGTWNTINGEGVQVTWNLASGTNYQTTAGSWTTGSFLSTSSQQNVLDATGNIFAITGCQLEAGLSASKFERRMYGTELNLCQRYFQKTYDQFPVDGSGNALNAVGGLTTAGLANVAINATSGTNYTQINLQTPMRAAPTIKLYDGNGNANALSKFQTGQWFHNITAGLAATNIGESSFAISYTGNSFQNTEMGLPHGVHYTADADF